MLSLGSAQLPTSALADFWARTAQATRNLPGLLGYDLMNEPVRLAGRGRTPSGSGRSAAQQSADAHPRRRQRRQDLRRSLRPDVAHQLGRRPPAAA